MTEIDTEKPNPARIYDYVLGGHHNFEADRIAGDRVISLIPGVRNGFRLNRWFMFQVVKQFVDEHYQHFIDLASGLPTEGYIHDIAPNAMVIYNDRDPVTVAYSRSIIGDNPNVCYEQYDIEQLDEILKVAEATFRGERKVAICIVGIAYFMSDELLQRVLDTMHTWAAPGSKLAMSFLTINNNHPQVNEISQMYARMGSAMHSRTPDQMRAMVKDWTIEEPGITRLNEWMGTPDWYEGTEHNVDAYDGYGMIISK